MSKRILAVASVLILSLAGWLLMYSPANAGTLSGSFYADPNSSVKRWLAANPNDSRAPLIASRIGSQPQGKWFATYNPSTVQSEVSA
ncbi:MAG TPA: cellobiohydrolase, partial [Micromonosporaceae bacterium]|nr:cellobiohydrolase [Micromonosporaceae bacterium]